MEATDENEELRRFREDWRREVAARKRADTVLSSTSSLSTVPNNRPSASESGLHPSISSPSEASHDDQPRLWPSKLGSAVEMYSEAVALEERGLLDAATQLYKRAFAVDSNVHKAYGRAVKSTPEWQAEQATNDTNDDLAKRVEKLTFERTPASDVSKGKAKGPLHVQSDGRGLSDKSRPKMAHLLSSLVLPDARALSFMPPPRLAASSDTSAPEQSTHPAVLNALTPIRSLPDELLVHILLFLVESPNSRHHHHHPRPDSSAMAVPELSEDDDWLAAPRHHTPGVTAAPDGATNIERFAKVCWKARVLTLDPGVWRSVDFLSPLQRCLAQERGQLFPLWMR